MHNGSGQWANTVTTLATMHGGDRDGGNYPGPYPFDDERDDEECDDDVAQNMSHVSSANYPLRARS